MSNSVLLLDFTSGGWSFAAMFGHGAPKKGDNSKYYDVLKVSKSALQDELKKAYMKAAIQNHPDNGIDL